MPESLPKGAKHLWEKVYNDATSSGDSEEKAAKKAWSALKQAGWSKDENGQWHKKSDVEFSMTITKASYDKASNKMKWLAVASDTDDDKRQDNMTQGLFEDFIHHIEENDPVPLEEFKSDYWSGGMPYLSIAHYLDLNGDGVPGVPNDVYIDGKMLKARGDFFDTPLGRMCFKAVCDDLYGTKKSDLNKIRISIAFLDYQHRHKDTNTVFIRESVDDICEECVINFIKNKGQVGNREFQKGQLVHLALTRVPVNERTLMEVEKSMTTRKEDAVSIVGAELVEELDEKEALVGKSEALIIKAEQPENSTNAHEAAKEQSEHECNEGESAEDCEKRHQEEMKKKSEVVEAKSDVSEFVEQLNALRLEIKSLAKPEQPKEVHILDNAIAVLKSAYDTVATQEIAPEEKLRQIQQSYNELGEAIKSNLTKVETPEASTIAGGGDIVKAFSDALQPLVQKLDLISTQLQQRPVTPTSVPPRRSVDPASIPQGLQQKSLQQAQSSYSTIKDIVNRTTQ